MLNDERRNIVSVSKTRNIFSIVSHNYFFFVFKEYFEQSKHYIFEF